LRPVPYTLSTNNNGHLKLNDTLERQPTNGQGMFSPNNMTTTLNNMMMMTSTVNSGDINPLGPIGSLNIPEAQA